VKAVPKTNNKNLSFLIDSFYCLHANVGIDDKGVSTTGYEKITSM
jgi:hypothetical protein